MLVLTRKIGEGFQVTLDKLAFFIRYDRPATVNKERGILCSLSGSIANIQANVELTDFGTFKKFWLPHGGEVTFTIRGETLKMSIQTPRNKKAMRGSRFGFVGPAFEILREEIV